MKTYLASPILGLLLVCSLAATPARPEYKKVKIEEIFSKLITREEADRIYSGQIKSKAGLVKFEKVYGIDVDNAKVDFEKQMLIFGITDDISTRAFQFLKQEKIRKFTLDYADTGIEYTLRNPGDGKKHSHIQVFVMKKTNGIAHICVKNVVSNGLSKVYDKENHNN